ncbi:ABC-2 transporter permease [Tissierella praeacuta]|uniref:ABC-2 transporter permease n=1 Tax=Tissierella praeacuta TaxID=43131 RepID=UPI001C0F6AB3|nr:ABC-2 transporter permease [Tissierella praeacuta]MBU5255911.1 ABC-2 transporter permease [Tissierella praeacuta]
MLNLIRKDLLLNFSSKQSVIFLILFFPFMLLVLETNSTNIYSLMILSYGYVLNNMPFKYEVINKTHMLIQSLPIKKRDVILSKYISIFINYFLGVILVGIYFGIISVFRIKIGEGLSISLIWQTLIIFIFITSISLPAYFRLPPRLGNIVNVMIYIIIINIFVIGSSDNIDILTALNGQRFNLPIITPIVYLISMLISIVLYETKDLA